jgi:membrane-bound metal-dependent hydrolase YbcI (DUF457 family)
MCRPVRLLVSSLQRLVASRDMSSPIGHALAGYAAGVLVAGRHQRTDTFPVSTRDKVLLFAGLACLPDVDFLFGAHSMYTHSIGAVLIVTAIAALVFRSSWRTVAACAVAYGSHLVLDWLGNDTSPPIGIMALWPFNNEYYQVSRPIFLPVSRRYWLPNFWQYNLLVVGIEVALFGMLALAAHWYVNRDRNRAVRRVQGL